MIHDMSKVEQKKIQLISMITRLYNIDLLQQIEHLLLSSEKDWWHSISDAEKQAIDIGLEDIKNGHIISNEQMNKEINERFKDL